MTSYRPPDRPSALPPLPPLPPTTALVHHLIKPPRERGTDIRRRANTFTVSAPRVGDPLPDPIGDAEGKGEHRWLSLAEVEAEHIRRTLEETFYNQSAAAKLLGVDRKLLSRKIKKYGLTLPRRRGRPGKHRSYAVSSAASG